MACLVHLFHVQAPASLSRHRSEPDSTPSKSKIHAGTSPGGCAWHTSKFLAKIVLSQSSWFFDLGSNRSLYMGCRVMAVLEGRDCFCARMSGYASTDQHAEDDRAKAKFCFSVQSRNGHRDRACRKISAITIKAPAGSCNRILNFSGGHHHQSEDPQLLHSDVCPACQLSASVPVHSTPEYYSAWLEALGITPLGGLAGGS